MSSVDVIFQQIFQSLGRIDKHELDYTVDTMLSSCWEEELFWYFHLSNRIRT